MLLSLRSSLPHLSLPRYPEAEYSTDLAVRPHRLLAPDRPPLALSVRRKPDEVLLYVCIARGSPTVDGALPLGVNILERRCKGGTLDNIGAET